jgi:hypothetical protein
MKKIIASAVGLMLVGGVAATTASAVEMQFGGYWRTRAYTQNDFKQNRLLNEFNRSDGDGSYSLVDNRTRLYLTAKFNDDFKFVNKFEWNTVWGDGNGGDVGADGTGIIRVKNSYADFTLADVNTKVGIMGHTLSRGLMFDDDFSGIIVSPNFGNVGMSVGYISVRSEDGGNQPFDQGMPFVSGNFNVNDALSLKPYFLWNTATASDNIPGTVLDQAGFDSYYLGLDGDWKLDALSLWGTFIYNFGSYDGAQFPLFTDDGRFLGFYQTGGDISGWLGAVGVDAGIAHGQVFYASGDDNSPLDGDTDAFQSAPGQSYYWSEIMGYGIFDNRVSTGSPGDKISNIWAVNAGVTFVPMDKMKLVGDLWYAALAEDDAFGNTDLGFEIDGKMTYALMDNLSADFVLAYLFAGDATGDDDVFEGGVRLSLSF